MPIWPKPFPNSSAGTIAAPAKHAGNTQADEASEIVLSGFALRADAKIVAYPERYSDPRGEPMWATVMGLLAGLEAVLQRVAA